MIKQPQPWVTHITQNTSDTFSTRHVVYVPVGITNRLVSFAYGTNSTLRIEHHLQIGVCYIIFIL